MQSFKSVLVFGMLLALAGCLPSQTEEKGSPQGKAAESQAVVTKENYSNPDMQRYNFTEEQLNFDQEWKLWKDVVAQYQIEYPSSWSVDYWKQPIEGAYSTMVIGVAPWEPAPGLFYVSIYDFNTTEADLNKGFGSCEPGEEVKLAKGTALRIKCTEDFGGSTVENYAIKTKDYVFNLSFYRGNTKLDPFFEKMLQSFWVGEPNEFKAL